MTIRHLLGSVALTVFIGACGSKGGNADIEAFMKLENEKGVAFAAGGKDCEAKAKSVGEWRTKNSAKYKELQKKLKEQWKEGPPKDVLEKHGKDMKAAKSAVMDAMLECSSNETFGKMMDDTKTE